PALRTTYTSIPPLTQISLLPIFYCTDHATTDLSTLSLHDALPIFSSALDAYLRDIIGLLLVVRRRKGGDGDGINSAAQAGNTVFAVTVGLGRLFRALLAHHLYG